MKLSWQKWTENIGRCWSWKLCCYATDRQDCLRFCLFALLEHWIIVVCCRWEPKNRVKAWSELWITCVARPAIFVASWGKLLSIMCLIGEFMIIKKKVKLSRYMPWRHMGERRYSSYSFLTLALDEGEWSASRPGCALHPQKGPPVSIG
jgi:hypothetical protein